MLIRKRYDRVVHEILKRWKKGESINWRSLTLKRRKAYVIACLHWSDLPKQPVKSRNYIIDATQIRNAVDFFCLLGEVFWGERGYFGRDLTGFYDCFCEIYKYHPKKLLVEPNTVVTIINPARLEKVLNRRMVLNRIQADYYSYFLEILEKFHFEVRFII